MSVPVHPVATPLAAWRGRGQRQSESTQHVWACMVTRRSDVDLLSKAVLLFINPRLPTGTAYMSPEYDAFTGLFTVFQILSVLF